MHIGWRAPEKLGERLQQLSEKTGRPKSYYIRKAVEEFLETHEKYILAVNRLEDRENPAAIKKALKEIDKKRK